MQPAGGDIINATFDVENIRKLKKELKELLEKAEETQAELAEEMAELMDVLNQVPQGSGNVANLKSAVSSLNGVLGEKSYQTYKKQVEKNLNRIMENVPKTDKKCGDDLKNVCDTLDKIKNDIRNITDMIPKTGKGIDSKKFQNEVDYYTKKLENYNNNELKYSLQQTAEFVAYLKGDDLSQTKSSVDPVNLSTGNFYYGYSDLKIEGEPVLDMNRFYNALYPREGSLGAGWQHPYEVRLLIEEDAVLIIKENGQEEIFKRKENGEFSCEESRNLLTKTEKGYCYQKQNGTQQIFDENGKYLQLIEAQNHEVRMVYEEELLKKVIRETDGAELSFVYDEEGRLKEVTDDTGRKISYGYDEEGRLNSVTNPVGESYHYAYDQEGHLVEIESPQQICLVKTEYDEDGRAKKQTFPDKSSMTFSYDEEKGEVLLQERDGNKTIYCHNERYQNVKVIYEDGTQESDLYNKKGQLMTHRDALGRATRYAKASPTRGGGIAKQ